MLFLGPSNIHVVGRHVVNEEDELMFDWPAVRVSVRVQQTSRVHVLMDGGGAYFDVYSDGFCFMTLRTQKGEGIIRYELASDLNTHQSHTITLVKRTEPHLQTSILRYECVRLRGFTVDGSSSSSGDDDIIVPPPSSRRRIEFVGDSDLTGFGAMCRDPRGIMMRPELQNADISFGAVCARLLDAEYHIIAASGRGLCRQLSLALGFSHISDLYPRAVCTEPHLGECDWQKTQPDVVQIYCGANDFCTPLIPSPSVEQFAQAYSDLVRLVRSRRPDSHIICMTLSRYSNLSGVQYDSNEQRQAHDHLCRGIYLAVSSLCTSLQNVSVVTLALDQDLQEHADFGLLHHWTKSGHKKVGEALARALRERLSPTVI